MIVYMASYYDFWDGATKSQPCSTRDRAVKWLADLITASEWEEFYDGMSDSEREFISRDRSSMPDEELLGVWAVRSDIKDEWNTGDVFFRVDEVEVLS